MHIWLYFAWRIESNRADYPNFSQYKNIRTEVNVLLLAPERMVSQFNADFIKLTNCTTMWDACVGIIVWVCLRAHKSVIAIPLIVHLSSRPRIWTGLVGQPRILAWTGFDILSIILVGGELHSWKAINFPIFMKKFVHFD